MPFAIFKLNLERCGFTFGAPDQYGRHNIYKNERRVARQVTRRKNGSLGTGWITVRQPAKTIVTLNGHQYHTSCDGHVRIQDAMNNNSLELLLNRAAR